MSYDKFNALVANVQAIELAMKIRLQGRRATDSEKEVLSRYSGFGGIKEVLNIGTNNPIDRRMAEPIARLQRLIAEYPCFSSNVIESIKASVLTVLCELGFAGARGPQPPTAEARIFDASSAGFGPKSRCGLRRGIAGIPYIEYTDRGGGAPTETGMPRPHYPLPTTHCSLPTIHYPLSTPPPPVNSRPKCESRAVKPPPREGDS